MWNRRKSRTIAIILTLLCTILHVVAADLSPTRLIVVDAINGDDATCAALDLSGGGGGIVSAACRSLHRAFELSAGEGGNQTNWIQMTPGQVHITNVTISITVQRALTISSQPPPDTSEFVFPTSVVGVSATWNCGGLPQCISFVSSFDSSVRFTSIEFRNVTSHAIAQYGPSTNLTIEKCSFISVGGAVFKNGGTFTMSNTLVSKSGLDSNYLIPGYSMFRLIDVDTLLTGCTFDSNTIRTPIYLGGGLLSIESWLNPRRIVLSDMVVSNNLASMTYDSKLSQRIIGSGLAQVNASLATITISRMYCHDNYIVGPFNGACFGILHSSRLSTNKVSVYLHDSIFNHNFGTSIKLPTLWANIESGVFAVSNHDGIFAESTLLNSGATIMMENNTFSNSYADATIGVPLSGMAAINITKCRWYNNTGSERFSALSLNSRTLNFTPAPLWTISECEVIGPPFSTTTGGIPAFLLADLPTTVRLTNSRFIGNYNGARGGAISISTSSTIGLSGRVEIDRCVFEDNNAFMGGALSILNSIARITKSIFRNNTAARSGGAILSRGSSTIATGCTFESNHVSSGIPVSTKVLTLLKIYNSRFEGGAFSINAGTVSIVDCIFQTNHALPEGGLEQCNEFRNSLDTTSVTSGFWGGDLSAREVSIDVTGTRFTGSRSCTGGSLYTNGDATQLLFNDFIDTRAYIGGSIVIHQAQAIIDTCTFTQVGSLTSGGALALVEVSTIYLGYSDFLNSHAREDGGAIWIQPLASDSVLFSNVGNVYTDCIAPIGGGGIMFLVTNSAVPSLPFNSLTTQANTVKWTSNDTHALYGNIQASNIVSIQPSIKHISVYPGEALQLDRTISIFALDAYNQTVIGSSTVIQAVIQLSSASPPNVSLPLLSGTILQQMLTDDGGAAVFSDLTFAGTPGKYQIVFSIVGVKDIEPITLPLTILASCPIGLFFDSSPSERRCRDCGSSFLIYDSTARACLPCDSGWHVVKLDDGSSVCSVCQAGYTSTGGLCAPCASNTYQPAPGQPCRSCLDSGLDGLQCTSELAAIEPGWFAFTRIDESGIALLATAQCPDGYCSGGFVQSNWSDPITLLNGSTTSIAPILTSAVTRFDQCAYPRLASPDNLLCGECVTGHIPWGDKCAECSGTNGGMVLLLLVLSFGLVFFLLHSASSSASAGHSVIVLYFIQTCMLEVGSSSTLLSWLNIAIFSPNSTSQCIAPISVYGQATFQILMPVILFGELVIVGFIHSMVARRINPTGSTGAVTVSLDMTLAAAWTFDAIKSKMRHFMAHFSVDLYISATFALLLFSYTQVAVACLSYLACVDVGGTSVVFTQPSMRCQSSEYQSYLVLVIIAMITFVIGFPLGVLIFLWRRWDLIVASHRYMDRDASGTPRRPSPPPNIHELVKPTPRRPSEPITPFDNRDAVDAVVIPFLTRYSPLFSMYSNRAWFWQVLILVRRTIFVTFSVALVRDPSSKFLAYSLTHLTSLLVQMHFRPFSIEFFNVAEIVSHLLMILLSQSLTAVLPPYQQSTEIYLFILVIPPVGVYIAIAAYMALKDRRAQTQKELNNAIAAQVNKEYSAYADPSGATAGGVELTDVHTNSYAANPLHRGSVDGAGYTIDAYDPRYAEHISIAGAAQSAQASVMPKTHIPSDDNEVTL